MINKLKTLKRNKAAVALTTVIVVTGILLVGGISIVITSIDLSYASRDYNYYTLAKVFSRSCLEESIYKISEDNTYTGTVEIASEDYTCSAVVQNSSATVKSITVTSNYQDVNYQEDQLLDISGDNPELVSN